MHNRFTRIIAWVASAGTALAFALPAGAIEFFPTPFRYQWKSQSGTVEGDAHVVRANAGDTVAMSLTIINRSTDPRALTIYGKSALLPEASPYQGAHELRLGTARPHDNIPSWVDPSSFISNPDGASNRLAVYDGPAVNPGGDLTFNFNLKIKADAANGTYDLYLGVVREFDAWARQVDSAGRLLASEDIFWRFIIGGGAATTAGALNVSLSSLTPAAASVATGANANFTRFTLTAAAGTTVKISQILVTRDGLSADSDAENIKLLDADGVQIGGTAGGFNALHQAQIYINPAYELTGSKDFYLRAGIVSTATAGITVRLGIASNSDIISNATSTTGAPVYGNYMTAVSVTIGSVTVSEDGSVTDSTPDVGDTDVITNTFKITAGSVEPITIERITAMKAGSAETSDTTNIELWDVTNNKTLGTVTSWTSDGKASWPVNLKLGKGENIRLRIQLDVVDGVGLTVNSDIADGSDYLVFAKGDTYGFYITPAAAAAANWSVDSSGSNNLGQGDKNQTINSGSLTISKSASTPATGNITVADNQLLVVYDFDVRGESVRISAVHLDVAITDADAGGEVTYADLTNARLVDMATGNILSGPVDGSADGTDPDEEFDFTNTFVLGVGISKVGFKVRLGTDFENSDTLAISLDAAGNVTAKGLITNNSISPTIASGTGNTQTVKAGALEVRDLGVPPSGKVVAGAADFTWATMSLDASASGEDVLVSSITVGDNVNATGNMADIDNAELWADLDSNGTYETKVSQTEQPDGSAGTDDTHAFTLTQTIRVPKGGFIKLIFVADLSSSATANGTHQIGIVDSTVTAADVTATGADTGNDISESDSGGSGTMTVSAVGGVTVALDGSSPTPTIMLAGTTGNVAAKFKLTATDEAFTVRKIRIILDNWGGPSLDQWDSISKVTIEYPKQDGTTGSKSLSPSDVYAQFDNLDMYIGKNTSAVVTVKLDFWNIATESADFGDQIKIGFDVNSGGFDAVGLSSGTVITNAGNNDVTADTHVLYKTLLTVTKDTTGMSSVLTPGATNDLYKFKITADSRGNAALKRLTWSITITDNGTTSTDTDLERFTLVKDSVDLTIPSVSLVGATGNANNTDIAARLSVEGSNNDIEAGTSWVTANFGSTVIGDTENSIPAGTTTSWVLRATAGTGYAGADDDSVSVELVGDTDAPNNGAFYLEDNDDDPDQYALILAASDGTDDAEGVSFIWSDLSAISHSANVPTDTGDATPTSSADWANGWLIKNFPLGSWSLIA